MTRLVVTTIPMVAVVGTAAVGKSYAAGGLISGSYAAGEAAGAIWLTHKLKQVGIGRELRTICLVGGYATARSWGNTVVHSLFVAGCRFSNPCPWGDFITNTRCS